MRTFEDIQAEYLRSHPDRRTMGTAGPTAEEILMVHLTEAIDALSERLASVEKRLENLEGVGEGR